MLTAIADTWPKRSPGSTLPRFRGAQCARGRLGPSSPRRRLAPVPRLRFGDRPALDEGAWEPENVGACQVTGAPLDEVLDQMYALGLTAEDVGHLERLEQPGRAPADGQQHRSFPARSSGERGRVPVGLGGPVGRAARRRARPALLRGSGRVGVGIAGPGLGSTASMSRWASVTAGKTKLPATSSNFTISLDIFSALRGKLLQFGFSATATSNEPSGDADPAQEHHALRDQSRAHGRARRLPDGLRRVGDFRRGDLHRAGVPSHARSSWAGPSRR